MFRYEWDVTGRIKYSTKKYPDLRLDNTMLCMAFMKPKFSFNQGARNWLPNPLLGDYELISVDVGDLIRSDKIDTHYKFSCKIRINLFNMPEEGKGIHTRYLGQFHNVIFGDWTELWYGIDQAKVVKATLISSTNTCWCWKCDQILPMDEIAFNEQYWSTKCRACKAAERPTVDWGSHHKEDYR